MSTAGGRFDFDDGGTYAGGWEDGKANGFGVCTGPKGQGEYAGAWHVGFETSGVYTWSSGNNFKGQWMQGKRHGVGVEVKGRWIYQGEWTQGFKGRYGIRQSTSTGAKFEGTWTTGLQDGYGVETYADGGVYQGQWLRGIRHGYGVRQSVPYGEAAHHHKTGHESLTSLRSEHEEDYVVKDRDRKLDEKRGGFVLMAIRSDEMMLPIKKRSGLPENKSSSRTSLRKTIVEGLKLRKQRSTGDIQDTTSRARMRTAGGSVRSTISNSSHASYGSFQSSMTAATVHTNSDISFISQDDDITDVNMVETYMGEWKNDKRAGFGISERSDGLRYEGEWDANKRHGYGSTTFKDGTKEEGKYKNNVLISSGKKSKLFLLRASKVRDRVQNAVSAARSAKQIALQKAEIAVSRMTTARSKAEMAVAAAEKAQSDSEKGREKAAEYAPDFFHPPVEKTETSVPTRSPLLSFGDHYDISTAPSRPRYENRTPLPALTARSILSRVANIAGVDKSHETRKPPPSIASALVSVAVDSSAALLKKNLNQGGGGGGSGMGLPFGLGGLAIGLGGGLGDNDQAGVKTNNKKTPTLTESNKDVGGTEPSGVTQRDPARTADTGSKKNAGLSETAPKTIIDDHFDQYQTWSRPSTISSQTGRARNPFPLGGPSPSQNAPRANSPLQYNDSTDSAAGSRPVSTVSRRQTLITSPVWDPNPSSSHQIRNEVPSRSRTSYGPRGINENGVLNMPVNSAAAAAAQPSVVQPSYRPPSRVSGGLRRSTGGMGSMPQVAQESVMTTVSQAQKPMSREEVHLLSLRRREEIRRQREAEERRRQDEVVLSFGEFKEWCRRRQLVVLVLAVNISLATMFYNLLSY